MDFGHGWHRIGGRGNIIRATQRGLYQIVPQEIGVQILRIVQRLRSQGTLRGPGDEGTLLRTAEPSVRRYLIFKGHDLPVPLNRAQHDEVTGMREMCQLVDLGRSVGDVTVWREGMGSVHNNTLTAND